MYYAGRINSFILKGGTVFEAINAYKKMSGMTHLEFNYPEHIKEHHLDEIKKAIAPMKVNGLATRFRGGFENGEFTNPNDAARQKAIALVKETADVCRALGGKIVTLWLAYDGFDYPFQMNYEQKWLQVRDAIREAADYAKDIRFSIEYKPFEPRNFAILDSVGSTLLMVDDIGRENVGVTLDFCHMLMKHDSPAFGLSLAASRKKLFGLHMNDGYPQMDSGMIFGTVNFSHALEFVYYLKKYQYDGVVFFDTFPVRESAQEETMANIHSFEKYISLVDTLGMDAIQEVIDSQDGIKAQKLILSMLK